MDGKFYEGEIVFSAEVIDLLAQKDQLLSEMKRAQQEFDKRGENA